MKVALITGCSSGFGARMAGVFGLGGWHVYAGYRNAAPHLNKATQHFTPLQLDVSSQAEAEAAMAHIAAASGRLDLLINNAGIDALGAFEDQPEATLREIMEVNFFAPLRLARLALPLMRRQKDGHLIFLSSLSGLVGLPGSSAYAASKFALEGAVESLYHEVGRFGIKVALIEPGGFATEMASKLALAPGYSEASPYWPMLQALKPGPDDRAKGDDPEIIARLVYDAVAQGSTALRHPAGSQATAVVARLARLDDAARADFVRDVTGLGWWAQGKAANGKAAKGERAAGEKAAGEKTDEA